MEVYGSKSATDAALGFGIAGTSLGVLGTGILGNVFGGGNVANNYVNKETFDLSLKLSSSESANALLQAELSSEKKMVEVFNAANDKINNVYAELSARIRELDKKIDDSNAAQAVINCKCSSAVTLLQNQVGQLFEMTKLVIPNASISPGWDT